MDKKYIRNPMSIKFSSSTNSNSGGISGGVSGSKFCGVVGSKLRSKFKCIWGGIIVGVQCSIILSIEFIFLPIILIIWGILIIRGWVWKFRRRGKFGK
jgi:hypothetical protein